MYSLYSKDNKYKIYYMKEFKETVTVTDINNRSVNAKFIQKLYYQLSCATKIFAKLKI